MFCKIQYENYHNYFENTDWTLEEIKRRFVITPTTLRDVLYCRSCPVVVVNHLINIGSDINCIDAFGHSPLMISLMITNDKEVIRVLLERGAEVNKVDWENKTPLLLYLERRDCSIDIVNMLLDFNATVNHKDKHGGSPLTAAIRNVKDDAVIQLLVEKGAEVSDSRNLHNSPLLVSLRERKDCSDDTVQLLLANGADTNCADKQGNSPLALALKYLRSERIVQLLLKGGAGVNTLDGVKKSILCIAFRHSSIDVVKLLLDAGSSPSACAHHRSPLHCATDFSESGSTEDILKLLLKTNLDVNMVADNGQSVVCFALQNGAKANDIKLLLDAGASINTCKQHSSPLICATEVFQGTPLRGEVIKLLIDNRAKVDTHELNILENALRNTEYDTQAIQLLLDLPGMDAYVVNNRLLLHHAVENVSCTPDAIKLLLNRNAHVLSLDACDKTSLHYAASNFECDASIIKLLLEHGSPVDAESKNNETPLMMAVSTNFRSDIIKELLLGGARIRNKMFHRRGPGKERCDLLEYLTCELPICYDPESLLCYQMLTKFFLLQNQTFHTENFYQGFGVGSCTQLVTFVYKCLSELEVMNILEVSNGHTLHTFVARDCLSAEKNYDINKILIYLTNYSFPVFHDIISARIGRPFMEAEVKNLQLYTNKIQSMKQINLNRDIMLKIYEYLPDEDLLKFILASKKPFNMNDGGETSKDDPLLGKRSCEPSTERFKCPKLNY